MSDIKKYLMDESASTRLAYAVHDLGVEDRVNDMIDDIAKSYEAGGFDTATDLFGRPAHTNQPPQERALEELKRSIVYLAKQEYFAQMGREDALTILRGLHALSLVKGSSWTVMADIIGGERISWELFMDSYNQCHPGNPIKFDGPKLEI